MGRIKSPVRPRLLLPYHPTRKSIFLRFVLLIGILSGFQFLRLHYAYQAALQAKYVPTDFGNALPDFNLTNDQLRARHDLIATRPEWKRLGGGCEGATFVHGTHVIKTFNSGKLPRNCMPVEQGGFWTAVGDHWEQTRWPPEIPASILLAGQEDSSKESTGLVPVTDFFLAETEADVGVRWHLVSRLASGGNLYNLARRLRQGISEEPQFRAVDEAFRPAFHSILETLRNVHEHGLCHDDVKPDNIFIGEDDSQWYLGDLGNIRHVEHPYHGSRIWQLNDQVPDCRANDVLRAVKTYLTLLRLAADDATEFDVALFEGKEPWSRLYWMARQADISLSASRMQDWSQNLEPALAPPHYLSKYTTTPLGMWNPFALLWNGKKGVFRKAADEVLAMRLGEKWARVFALTDWFGVPIAPCPSYESAN